MNVLPSEPPLLARHLPSGWNEVPRRAIALGLAIGLVIVAFAASIAWRHRADTYESAMRTGRDVARSLSHDIERSLQSYDLSLRSVANDLRMPDLMQLPIGVRNRVFFDSSAKAKYLGPIRVLDRDGFVTMDSTDRVPRHVNLSSSAAFEYHATHADANLLIGRPFTDDNGESRIALSRRVSLDDGSFGGVVLGTIELAYFEDLFSKLDLGESSAVSLVLDDATLLMRVPHVPADIGRDLSASATFVAMLSRREGTLDARASIDGVRRHYFFMQVGTYPLSMVVGQSSASIYRTWMVQTIWIAFFTFLLLSCCGALAFILRRELLRRSRAEAALSALNVKLEELAREDGLTRLPNRRAFDQAIAAQCLQFNRHHEPLALLMIDIDHFKAFNDRFGHPQGDVCIRAVADEIRRCITRPSDLAARYGGEEFVMLLPATGAAGAIAVAERLRSSLRTSAIPHTGGVSDVVTVSIGLGVIAASASRASAEELIEQADRALYLAKQDGRDCIRGPGESRPEASRWSTVSMALRA